MHDPGDPGGTLPAGDPQVSRVIYALRDLRIDGPAMAESVLEAANVELWMRPEQIAAVMQAFKAQPRLGPVGPAYIPPDTGDPDGDE